MRRKSKSRILIRSAGLLASIMIPALSGCSGTSASASGPQMPLPEVEVVPVEQRDVPIYREWIGTLDGMVNAAIKAQVTGYLLTQNYAEGSFVRKGQLLFEIDPRPFQAAFDQAQGQLSQANGQLAQAKAQLVQSQAQLAQAQANQRRTQLDVDRYVPLAKQQAITQQDLDNATQNNLSAQAQVDAAKAQIETAKAQIQAAGRGRGGGDRRGRGGAGQPWIHAPDLANRRNCRQGAGPDRQPGEFVHGTDHDGLNP